MTAVCLYGGWLRAKKLVKTKAKTQRCVWSVGGGSSATGGEFNLAQMPPFTSIKGSTSDVYDRAMLEIFASTRFGVLVRTGA